MTENKEKEQDEVEQALNQAQQLEMQAKQMRAWALQQAADYRAKAEVGKEIEEHGLDTDELDTIPADPEQLRAAADEIESVLEAMG